MAEALPGLVFDGLVTFVQPVVNDETRTVRVPVHVENREHLLKPGMFGRIDVIYDHKQDALTVPRSALIEEDGQTAVYLLTAAPPPASVETPKGGEGTAVAAPTPDKPDASKPPALQAQRRVIQIGYADSSHVEVRDGLIAGDRVITVGRNAVRDGTLVQVLDPDVVKPAAAQVSEGGK